MNLTREEALVKLEESVLKLTDKLKECDKVGLQWFCAEAVKTLDEYFKLNKATYPDEDQTAKIVEAHKVIYLELLSRIPEE